MLVKANYFKSCRMSDIMFEYRRAGYFLNISLIKIIAFMLANYLNLSRCWRRNSAPIRRSELFNLFGPKRVQNFCCNSSSSSVVSHVPFNRSSISMVTALISSGVFSMPSSPNSANISFVRLLLNYIFQN